MPQHIIGNLPVIYPYDTQTITVAGTAAKSAILNAQTIRLVSTTNCHIAIGSNPTALATDTYLPAGVVEYFMCGIEDYLSVIQDAAGGTLYITRHV